MEELLNAARLAMGLLSGAALVVLIICIVAAFVLLAVDREPA